MNIDKATWAKLAGWLQLFITAVNEAMAANGIPKDAKAWGHILVSAAIGLALHHASGTDGTH